MAVDLTHFVPIQIQIEDIGVMLSGKSDIDAVFVLDDKTPPPPGSDQTGFFIESYPAGPGAHPVSLWVRMTVEQLRQLVTTLKKQEHSLPPTLNLPLFHAFLRQMEAEIGNAPSTRFNGARFGAISSVAAVLSGSFGIGVDVAGTVHDAGGAITAEQHVIPRPPGSFRRLSRADRLSLAAAINAFKQANPTMDPLWNTVATDATK